MCQDITRTAHWIDGSYQAAVSKHFDIGSCNGVTTLFPEKHRNLAMIALGSKAESQSPALSYKSHLSFPFLAKNQSDIGATTTSLVEMLNHPKDNTL